MTKNYEKLIEDKSEDQTRPGSALFGRKD